MRLFTDVAPTSPTVQNPTMPGMPSELKPTFERYVEGPTLLTRAIDGIDPAMLSRPGTEGWAVRDVLVHLSDAEIVAAFRFRLVISEDNPALPVFDQDAWKKRLHYLWRSPEAALSLFQQTRFATAELLRQCDRKSWERGGTYPGDVPVTLAGLLQDDVDHLDLHIAQIRSLRHLA